MMLASRITPHSVATKPFSGANLSRMPRVQMGSRRSQTAVNVAAAAVAAPSKYTWDSVKRETSSELKGFVLRKGESPSTAPLSTLPTEADSHLNSTKPVVLFRDTNAWCPYCERVWLALEYKQIPYDSILINLMDKPAWYVDMVPTKLVPAVSFNGEVKWESQDILLALEERFPSPPLLPEDAEKRQEAMDLLAKLSAAGVDVAGFRFMAGGAFMSSEPKDPKTLPELKAEFEDKLHFLESKLAKNSGPFLMGSQITLVDICLISGMERVLACLPYMRGMDYLQDPSYPGLQAWIAALEALPAYQKVKSDPETLRLLFRKRFTMGPPGVSGLEGLDEAAMQARREVAARLYANRAAIVQDIVSRSGLSRPRGSRYGQTMYSYNGYEAAPSPGIPEAVDAAMLWLAHYLLTGDCTRPNVETEAAAVSAVALAYFRNRASAPRDLSSKAAEQLRAACDHLLAQVF